jgi:hypothetical protein
MIAASTTRSPSMPHTRRRGPRLNPLGSLRQYQPDAGWNCSYAYVLFEFDVGIHFGSGQQLLRDRCLKRLLGELACQSHSRCQCCTSDFVSKKLEANGLVAADRGSCSVRATSIRAKCTAAQAKAWNGCATAPRASRCVAPRREVELQVWAFQAWPRAKAPAMTPFATNGPTEQQVLCARMPCARSWRSSFRVIDRVQQTSDGHRSGPAGIADCREVTNHGIPVPCTCRLA